MRFEKEKDSLCIVKWTVILSSLRKGMHQYSVFNNKASFFAPVFADLTWYDSSNVLYTLENYKLGNWSKNSHQASVKKVAKMF